jgi:HAMP domain-containing protein
MTVRLRLTLLYGGLFFVAGFLLLTVAYVLVTNILESLPFEVRTNDPFGISQQEQQAIRRSFIDHAQHRLLTQSAFALVGVGLIALALGWFVADRALGPLQKVTATARKLSESTLHERIAMQGPEDEIKELADTFDAMLERLNEAFDAQRSCARRGRSTVRSWRWRSPIPRRRRTCGPSGARSSPTTPGTSG